MAKLGSLLLLVSLGLILLPLLHTSMHLQPLVCWGVEASDGMPKILMTSRKLLQTMDQCYKEGCDPDNDSTCMKGCFCYPDQSLKINYCLHKIPDAPDSPDATDVSDTPDAIDAADVPE